MEQRLGTSVMSSFKNWYATSKQESGLYLALIALIVIMAFASDSFLSVDNFMTIIRQVSIVGIIAIGGFMVLLTGGMDISVGAVAALTSVVLAKLYIVLGFNFALAFIIALLVGVLVGLLNGFLATILRLPSFIITLGTMQMCSGLAYVITQATPIAGFPESFLVLSRGYLGGVVPWPVIILIALYVIMSLFMRYTKFGTYCYAIGGNRESARLSGIRVNKIQLIVYICGGLFSAIAGIIVAARTNSGSAQIGSSYIFDVFTALVLGGTSLSGGIGRLPSALVGCVFVGVLNNGLIQLNVNSFFQMMIQGIVLIIAMVLQWGLSKDRKVATSKNPPISAK